MTTSILNKKRCLVLNKNWAPVGTVTLERAIIMLFSTYANNEPKARIIEPSSYELFTWDDWSKLKPLATDEVIQGARCVFRVPEIILLSRYEKLPQPKVHFSRRTLYKRDDMMCQYCGGRPGSEELTIDHVIPRSQGGLTTWTNCILACVDCNTKKRDRTPEQAGMKLLKQPHKPKLHLFKFDTFKPVESWKAFISEAFWNVELENDMKKS
jgi:5-methylcytosine-specific restriction endonuclease McrA